MEDHSILSERLEDQLKAIEMGKRGTKKNPERERRTFIKRINEENDSCNY